MQDSICQHCVRPSLENGTTQPSDNQRSEPEAPLETTDQSPIDFWGRTTEQQCQLLKRINLEVVHWKPKLLYQKIKSVTSL